MVRLAIVDKGKCKPLVCHHDCAKCCPINKGGQECIIVDPEKKASIDEKLCVGCAICPKRCPFEAIQIVNLPSVKDEDLVQRFGSNGFALYGLPLPKENSVLGLLGRNGIGKSTAVKILAGKEKPNFGGRNVTPKEFFKGNEMMNYFDDLEGKRIAYKPQNLSSIAVDLKVSELFAKVGDLKLASKFMDELGVLHLMENKLNKLSGGELQKVAIVAAVIREADIYFFDEPLAFLDIAERLKVSDFIKKIAEGKTVIVVEHDLLILDYLTEYLNVFFGVAGAFGLVSGLKSSANGVNSYLDGYLKEENLQLRDKALNFNFTKNPPSVGYKIGSWPAFEKNFGTFKLKAEAGDVFQNHVVGILGKNGTGKTTFVKCLAGEEKVIVDGKEQKLDLDLKISYKPQYLFTDSDDMVRDVMIREKISKKVASMFSLEVLHHKKVKDLSGGELQRFSIARCLAKEADLYLLDEPSAYLDVEERISCAKAIKDLMVEKEKTAFVVDHDLLLVSYLADNIVNFSGVSGKEGHALKTKNFEDGISELLKSLDITLRKEKVSGRPRINKKGSVLDRGQKEKGEWAVF
jgi:ATP-binding cassette subfamily E protein 1